MTEDQTNRKIANPATGCSVPGCHNPEDVRVLGYQSGLELPDSGDRYPLCGPHYQEYREKNLVNIGWLERMGVRMRPIRYCITPDCGNSAYNESGSDRNREHECIVLQCTTRDEEESRAEPNDGTGETPLCWPCFLETAGAGALPEKRNSSEEL